jgi:hypothetical protein
MEGLNKLVDIRNLDGRKLLPDILLLLVVGLILLNIVNAIKTLAIFNSYLSAPKEIWILVGIVLWLIIFITIKPIIKFLWHWLFSISPWSRTIEFNAAPTVDLNNILFQGKLKILDDSVIHLTNSHSGFVFKNLWWKNFKASFKFKFDNLEISAVNWLNLDKKPDEKDEIIIIPQKFNNLGFIFRAQNLEDYFMIIIGVQRSKKEFEDKKVTPDKDELPVVITPHIRLGGKWEIFGGEPLEGATIKIKEFNSVKITVVNALAIVEINDKLYTWNLPTNFERGTAEIEKARVDTEKITQGVNSTRIPFRTSFGMIGFRASGAEKFQLKNIKIKRLPN